MNLSFIRIGACASAALFAGLGCARDDGPQRSIASPAAVIAPPAAHAATDGPRLDDQFTTSAVALTGLTPIPRGFVALRWETADEVDVRGYNLFRSEDDAPAWTRANERIIQAHGAETDNIYEFVDSGLRPGRQYLYYIEEVLENGDARRLSQTIPMTARERVYD